MYSTTNKFLENFGINSVDDLPSIDDFAPDEETKRFIYDRLSDTKSDQQEKLEGIDESVQEDNKEPEKTEEEPSKKPDARSLFKSALAGAFGVTDKVNLDEIKLNTEDE